MRTKTFTVAVIVVSLTNLPDRKSTSWSLGNHRNTAWDLDAVSADEAD
jgi:hypothetical protein